MKLIEFIRKSKAVMPVVLLALCINACTVEGGPLEDGNMNETEDGASGEQPAGDGVSVTFDFKTEPDGDNPFFVVPGNDLVLEYSGENIRTLETGDLPEGWSAVVDSVAHKITVSVSADAERNIKITFKAKGDGNSEAVKEVGFYNLSSFDDPNGTFVLNEGNMTTENGSLTYITPEGYVVDDAYKTVNGTELGNVAQDMDFCNGKIYIISQNGNKNAVGSEFENDGMLVVMNAKTLKKEVSFTNDELSILSWPSHIAALDDKHVYIRDNKGVYRLDMSTKTLTFIEESDGAPKSQFVKLNGKVYTYKSGLMSKILEISAENDAVNSISLPFLVTYDINEVKGIKASDDGKIWIMSFGFGKSAIGKFNPATKEIRQHLIGVKVSVGSSGVAFAARGNDIYYADDMAIYHLAFDDENEDEKTDDEEPVSAEEWMIEVSGLDKNAGLMYNGLGVHPVTGRVYMNTIKSFAQFTQNHIWGFDFANSKETPAVKFENYTNFPVGFFFNTNN